MRSGDTLTLIAQRFGVSVADIVEANPSITNPNLIYVGQIIFIPVTEVPPTPPTPPPPTPPPPTPPPKKPVAVTRVFDGLEYTMRINKSVYRMGETVRISFFKKNILSVPLRIKYRTSQRVDFRITKGDRKIWQWSDNRVFTQALGTERFEPGEVKVFRVQWNQRADNRIVRPGVYRLTGWNLATPGVRLTLDFTIQ